MKIAYFDCISGISGNMTLGAMIACGLEENVLRVGLAGLSLPGWELSAEPVTKAGISAIFVRVHETAHGHHHHRGLKDITSIIEKSSLSARVKETATAIFTRLADAEAAVHGVSRDEVHFHEVGAIDAIVDIVGTAIGLEALGIERVYASPLPLGRGWVTCAHGVFPVPAPATAALVQGVPIAETDIEAELVTPTGAAIITTLTERFGAMPAMTVQRVGYGAGSRDLPRPNVLRLFIGDAAEAENSDMVISLETTVDDMTGEELGYLMERLFSAGALDVYFTPVQMKKNRPGTTIRALCHPENESACIDILFRESTTLGIRREEIRRIIAPRSFRKVETEYGEITIKVSAWNGVERAEPEYEDCRRIAEEKGISLREVKRAAREAFDGGCGNR